MIDKTITLNKSEQTICETIAMARFNNNRENNITNAKVGDQDNYETDLEGFAAEVAFCKLFNVYPDFSVETRTSKEDDGDCIVNSKTVDVKTTKYKSGKLLAVSWKESNVDLFALMIGEFPTYTFKGFMTSKELLKKHRLGSMGYRETYIAKQHELVELDEIENNYNYMMTSKPKFKWDKDNNLINTETNESIRLIKNEHGEGYLIETRLYRLEEITKEIINITCP